VGECPGGEGELGGRWGEGKRAEGRREGTFPWEEGTAGHRRRKVV